MRYSPQHPGGMVNRTHHQSVWRGFSMSSMYPPYDDASARRCQRCGRPLAPNEVYCGTCGEYNYHIDKWCHRTSTTSWRTLGWTCATNILWWRPARGTAWSKYILWWELCPSPAAAAASLFQQPLWNTSATSLLYTRSAPNGGIST